MNHETFGDELNRNITIINQNEKKDSEIVKNKKRKNRSKPIKRRTLSTD